MAHVNTTTDKIIMRQRDGTPVKCVICSGNHYPNKCPNKGHQPEDMSTNQSQSSVANTTTSIPSEVYYASQAKGYAVATVDIMKETTISTVNAKQLLTISDDGGSNYSNT